MPWFRAGTARKMSSVGAPTAVCTSGVSIEVLVFFFWTCVLHSASAWASSSAGKPCMVISGWKHPKSRFQRQRSRHDMYCRSGRRSRVGEAFPASSKVGQGVLSFWSLASAHIRTVEAPFLIAQGDGPDRRG